MDSNTSDAKGFRILVFLWTSKRGIYFDRLTNAYMYRNLPENLVTESNIW